MTDLHESVSVPNDYNGVWRVQLTCTDQHWWAQFNSEDFWRIHLIPEDSEMSMCKLLKSIWPQQVLYDVFLSLLPVDRNQLESLLCHLEVLTSHGIGLLASLSWPTMWPSHTSTGIWHTTSKYTQLSSISLVVLHTILVFIEVHNTRLLIELSTSYSSVNKCVIIHDRATGFSLYSGVHSVQILCMWLSTEDPYPYTT